MTSVMGAHQVALALVAAAPSEEALGMPRAVQVEAWCVGELAGEFAPPSWTLTRVLAGVALVAFGFDDGEVRRSLGLSHVGLPRADKISTPERYNRMHRAWAALREART